VNLTDEELAVAHRVLYDEVFYGDDYVVYGDSPEAEALRSVLRKVEDEAKKRRLW
jgi:hypothetical protein